MWPDRVSNSGPLTYESGALPTALCGPAGLGAKCLLLNNAHWRLFYCTTAEGSYTLFHKRPVKMTIKPNQI